VIISSRTPLRVSLFGGGSDYPAWYREHPGAVLGFTLDKYIYISALPLTAFVDYRYRVSYSRLEVEQQIALIKHPVVRTVLEREGYAHPLDCSIQSDLPANAGLGSSSAFTVGFLNLVSALNGTPRTKLELARLAIELEQQVLNEQVGIQDQLHATFGGLNRFDFHGDQLHMCPIQVSGADLDTLTDWFVLVFTDSPRNASATLEEQIQNTGARRVDKELSAMVALVDDAQEVFQTKQGEALPIALAGLLEESWRLKRRLSTKVTNEHIDAVYERCKRRGALAGKLCGAGGGGFLLMVVPPDCRPALIDEIGEHRCVKFRIEHSGSTVRSHW
jgi:D-glycero-alpha-D-manno-heptose-7-phosphate kinase